MKRFTPEEDQFLIDNYLTIPATSLSRMLGRAKAVARQRMAILGLVVPADVIQRFKDESRIKPGNVPFNKGKKQSDFMAQEAIERIRATQFRKGNLPHNTKADFEISIRADKRGVKYKFIRTGLGKWIGLHRYKWEEVYGPIPPKMNLVFKDGDTFNCDISNLELLSNEDLMRRNTVHNYPKPITQAIQLRGALNRQINKHLKKLSNEKQNQ